MRSFASIIFNQLPVSLLVFSYYTILGRLSLITNTTFEFLDDERPLVLSLGNIA